MTGDLMASGTNPGTTYTISPSTDPGVYHEDRVVVTEVTTTPPTYITQMFRVYGATLEADGWHFAGATTAYATVQNPDGSIHYFSYSGTDGWPTEAWAGSDNNRFYNAVDFGLSTDDTSGGVDNQVALQAALTAAFNGGGGTVFIPPGLYSISGASTFDFTGMPGTDHGVIIAGVSGDTELAQQDITADTFSFSGLSSGRGVRIRDLRITYVTVSETPETLAAAVRVTGSQNVTCERVYFNNCPQAFYADNALEAGIFDCTITYNNFSANEAGTIVPTMVTFDGAEEYIDNCVISQQPRSSTDDPGPTGCIGVVINTNGAGYYISNTHISDFTQGIVVLGGSNLTRLFCSNVSCESWTNSLVVEQPTGDLAIEQIYCSDCLFEQSGGSTDTTASGIVIGASGGSNSAIGEIFLNNCTVFQWPVAGVLVNAGKNIVITGGRYGSNAFNEGSTTGGITIAGGADVTISGADLTPKLVNPDFPTQAYAIAITAAVNGLYVRGCNMEGYTYPPGPLYLSSPGTQIEITDCAGYNDRGTIVTIVAPNNNTNFNGGAYEYFGPVSFYAANGPNATLTAVKIQGATTPLISGTFTLSPGSTAHATLEYNSIAGGKPSFLMVGH